MALNELVNFFEDKKIIIWGLGKEGISSYDFIRKINKDSHLTIVDSNKNILTDYTSLKEDKNISILCQEEDLIYSKDHKKIIIEEFFLKFDLILKSPGIRVHDNLRLNTLLMDKIFSQSDIFIKYFKENCIGVTGTKGKSSTVSFINTVLKKFGYQSVVLGNIGIPAFDYLNKKNDMQKNDLSKVFFIIELSSFQLELARQSPHISIILNLYQDHLDYHEDKEAYWKAKSNIASSQLSKDFLIINEQADEILKRYIDNYSKFLTNKIIISSETKMEALGANNFKEFIDTFSNKKTLKGKIIGNHMWLNFYISLFAISKVKDIKLDSNKILEAISDFESLPHRLEFVGNYKNISFYNDSISTIPQATLAAVKTLSEFNKIDFLILGGKDRGIEFHEFCNSILNFEIKTIFLIGETSKKIRDIFSAKQENNIDIVQSNSLKNSLELIKEKVNNQNLEKKHICLLSPAASSFDQFKNFEDRGNSFKKNIKDIFV